MQSEAAPRDKVGGELIVSKVSPRKFGLSQEKKIGLYDEFCQTMLQYVPAKFMEYGARLKLYQEA